MIPCRHPAAATLVVLLLSFRVTANFRLEIRVVDFSNSNNDCGSDGCDLFINNLCLDPLNDVCVKGSCSLDGDSRDLNLESGLPKTTSLTSESQPWPVDYRLDVDIKDSDVGRDDDIDEIMICKSLLISSNFTTEMDFSGGRVTLTLQFRVQCTNGYEGPRCDCLPQNDDENGHYRCEEDGSISCLPGYTDPSSFCRQDICAGTQCPPNTTCVGGDNTFMCECLEGADCSSPLPTTTSSPPNTTPSTTDSESSNVTDDVCSCENQGSCIEMDGVYSCICPEGFTGEKCSTEVPTDASPRPRPQNREGPRGMSTAAIAGIAAGIVLAALICCVVLAAAIVCVRLRRKKRTQVNSKQSQEGSGPIVKVPISPSQMVANPMYSEVRGKTSVPVSDTTTNGGYGESGSSVVTIRRMSNPLYGDPSSPDHSKTATEGLYSVPRKHSPTHSSNAGEGEEGEGGGWIYSDPDQPLPRNEGDENAVYSYATVGGASGDSTVVQGNAKTALPPSDSTYDTLASDHKTHQT